MSWSFSRRRVQATVVAVVLSVVTALLALSPAHADPASTDPGNASTACAPGSIDAPAALGKDGYALTYVPPGATMHFTAVGTYTTRTWSWDPTYTTANYTIYLTGYANGARQFGGPPGTQDGNGNSAPIDWFDNTEPAGTYPFSQGFMDTYTAPSDGPGVTLGLDMVTEDTAVYAMYSGAGISWSLQMTITGGSGGSATCQQGLNSEHYGPNQAAGQQCPSCQGGTAYSVDSLTGNEHWVLPGMALKSRGPGIDFQLAYNSQAASQNDSIGYGWHDSFDMSLSPGNVFDSEVVTQEGGATVTFIAVGSGSSTTWVAPPEFDATLVHNADGSWLFTRQHKELFTFDSTGKLTSIGDLNGYTTQLTYGAGGLSQVSDDAGHQLNVAWLNGNVSSITDVSDPANPRSMTFSYDAAGNLTGFGDIGGGVWTMGYDGSHRLTSVLNPRLAGTSDDRVFDYDAQGRVDWEQDAQGQKTHLYYDDPQAGSTRIVDPAGNARVDTYNAQGERTSVTVGYGTDVASTTHYVYDTSTGMVTDRVDGNGKHWKSAYADPNNPFSPTQTTDPMGRIRKMAYDSLGDLTSLTDAHGVTSTYTYDANGNLQTSTVAATTTPAGGGATVTNASPVAATTTYHHGDSAHPGDVTSIVDPRNNTWTYTHDSATGYLTRLQNPDGNTTSWTYYPQGWVHTEVSPRGNATGANPAEYTTTYTYNAYGEPSQVADPLNHTTVTMYYADGSKHTVKDGMGRETDYSYTPDGQLYTVTAGVGTKDARTLTETYWPDGNLDTSSYDPATVTTDTWDAAGRLDTVTDADGNITKYTYDANSNVLSTITGYNTSDASTTSTVYDDDNRPVTTIKGANNTSDAVATTSGYDIAAGTAPCTGDPMNSTVYCTTSMTGTAQTVRFYDAGDHLVQVDRPGGSSVTYTYNANGQVHTYTDPAGDVTTTDYNPEGQPSSSNNNDDSADNVSYTYYPDGTRQTMTDATGTTSYSYDRDGRLASVQDGANKTVGYDYNPAGQLDLLTYPDGRKVSYGYNGAGQPTSLMDDTQAAGGQTTTFGYRPDGTPTTTNLPNGDTITTAPNGEGQPNSITLTNSANASVASIGYGYDHSGRTASETDAEDATQPGAGSLNTNTTYGYYATGQLKTSTDTTTGASTGYAYDAQGNPTTIGATTQTFDASSQLTASATSAGTTNYGYDANGNRTSATPAGGTASSYTYDAAGRMVASTTPAPAAADGSDYHPLQVTRLVDTRAATRTGTCTTTCATLPAGGILTFQVTGLAGVPSSGVNAVQLAITILNAASAGAAVGVYPAGAAPAAGRNISTTTTAATTPVVVATSATGQVTIKSFAATDLTVDVEGYYAHTTGTQDSEFKPINGTRILDTRTPLGTCSPSPCARMAAGATTTVTIAGQGGIPVTGVAAVAYTLTAFTPAAAGTAVAWAADKTKPTEPNLTYAASTTISELLVTPLSSDGKIKLATTAASDFTIDLAGYYTTSSDGTGSIFIPYNPSSGTSPLIYDTRNGTGDCAPAGCTTLQAGATTTVSIAGHGTVPPVTPNAAGTDPTAVVLGVTAWAPSVVGYVNLWPADQPKSFGRVLSYAAGTNTTDTAQVALSAQGQIDVAASSTTDLLLTVEGWYQAISQPQTYTYNGDGLRTSKASGGTTTDYVYDTSGPVPQLLTDGTTDYIYAPTGAILESAPVGGSTTTTAYHLTDAIGSTRALINTTGAITGTYSYTPYGTLGGHTGATTPLQYAGGYTDPETGLVYDINRYYQPGTATFTGVDPLVDQTGQPYAYTNDDPTNETDPLGLFGIGSALKWAAIGTGAVVLGVTTFGAGDAALAAAVGAGALTGGAIDIGAQVANNLAQGCSALANISWGDVATSALLGGYTDGIGALAWDATFAPTIEAAAETVPEATNVLKGPIADAVPKNLPEQMALDAAKQGAGRQIMDNLADAPRLIANYGQGTWVKMQYVLRGNYSNVTVHYFRNLDTGLDVEFKFK